MIRPLRDLLVIRPIGKPPGKIGDIYIPDLGTSQNKNGCICEVLAAGPKVELAKVGSHVHVMAYGEKPAGDEVTINGEKCIMIRERDITGVVTHGK